VLVPHACKVVEVKLPFPPPFNETLSSLVRADFQYTLLVGTDTISPKIVAELLFHPHCEKKFPSSNSMKFLERIGL
jgi:hypothetical protein